jgi:hypothetical protein
MPIPEIVGAIDAARPTPGESRWDELPKSDPPPTRSTLGRSAAIGPSAEPVVLGFSDPRPARRAGAAQGVFQAHADLTIAGPATLPVRVSADFALP